MSDLKMEDLVGLVEEWADEKELFNAGAQLEKFFEEAGEMARAHGKMQWVQGIDGDYRDSELEKELMDAIGDVQVTLISFASRHDLDIKECLAMAYGEISEREGEVIEGVFTKQEDLN